MKYCSNCGHQISTEAHYCKECGMRMHTQGSVTTMSQIVVTSWLQRFLAWIIDVIILTLIFTPIQGVLRPYGLAVHDYFGWIPFINVGMETLFYFGYWTFMEAIYRQSIGKMILGIKIIQSDGRHPSIVQTAVSSLGKAFLLPLDCLIGWILYPTKGQRLFNYLSETTVVKISASTRVKV